MADAAQKPIRFTPAQAAAISARGGSLLVSAAAGSGKTRVLVERVVGLITDPGCPAEADSLLIMTFTNAAAAKLRADITERLGREVRAHPDDLRLRRQQMRLQRASIGTVDAFCLRFAQQHFASLDIPPDFTTADDADLFRIRQQVLEETLEQAYQDPDFRAFADLFDRGRTDATAGQTVLALYDFSRTLPYPQRSLQDFAAMWQTGAPPQDTLWGKTLLAAALARVQGARRLLAAAMERAARDDAVSAAYAAALIDDDAGLERLERRLAAGDWDAAVQEAAGFGWARLGRIKGGKAGNPAAFAASELRTRAKKRIDQLKTDLLLCTGAEFAADRAAAAPLAAALVRAVQDFSGRYFEAKVAEKLLDYADYEHLTLELLQDADGQRTPLCATVSAQYSAVLVDEYQDTNALQDAIYYALAKPDASNLFFVGDIKQSIYRFRQAEPSVFIEKQKAWPAWPVTEGPATIALDANFRSAPNVIASVNYIFETIFSAQLGGVDYGPGQRLVVGREGDYPGLCELDVIDGADAAGDARAIAARIGELCAAGFAVRDGGATRPCTPGDCCILLRTRADFAVYEAALRRAGIPVYADTAADLLDAPHVRPFAALLEVIDNPAQDVALAAVLLSPMFPFTPDDLVRLRRQVRGGSLYGAVLSSADPKFNAFADTLAEYRRLARTLPVDALIEELFARTGYLAAAGAMPDGARCRDDRRAFAAWASGAGRAGLPALVRAMRAARQNGGLTQSAASQARPGCVTVMTVHRSKGLEFPVVFVAGTAHRFNNADTLSPVLFHRELGVGMTLRAPGGTSRYKTLPYAALSQTIRTETLSEEMRILYVALTRAQDALFITLPLKDAAGALKAPALYANAGMTGPEALQDFQSWSGWLLTAALRHPDSGALWAKTDFLPCQGDSAAPLAIRVLDAPDALPGPEAPPPPAPDAALQAALLENFAWHSPDEALQDVPVKVSVSDVTHAARQTALERPAFLQKSGMTGAERGTAIHAFLQGVPFAADAPDLAAEVERQKRLRLLDPALADVLDLDAVRPFFESAVYRRIRHAAEVLREEPFITALPAAEIKPGAPAGAEVLVQGIADLVLVFDDHAEILDYKTDKQTDPQYYVDAYAAQLRLYRRAFALRLKVPVTRLTIYSFALAGEIDVPLA